MTRPCILDCNYYAAEDSAYCTLHGGDGGLPIPGDFTPEGFPVCERDDDDERICVLWYDNTEVVCVNVAAGDESRDRYAVYVKGILYTDQLRAPEYPIDEDRLGATADAACSFANADKLLSS